MPIVIKAKQNQSTNDLIRQFKKAATATNIVQFARDTRYFVKPSKKRAIKKEELKKQKKRRRSMKRMKNVPQPRPARR